MTTPTYGFPQLPPTPNVDGVLHNQPVRPPLIVTTGGVAGGSPPGDSIPIAPPPILYRVYG